MNSSPIDIDYSGGVLLSSPGYHPPCGFSRIRNDCPMCRKRTVKWVQFTDRLGFCSRECSVRYLEYRKRLIDIGLRQIEELANSLSVTPGDKIGL